MSLHSVCSPGHFALTMPAPVFRSKPFSQLPASLPATCGPITALMSLEQIQSMPTFSSASTPNVERVP